jgi:hypothetical protein
MLTIFPEVQTTLKSLRGGSDDDGKMVSAQLRFFLTFWLHHADCHFQVYRETELVQMVGSLERVSMLLPQAPIQPASRMPRIGSDGSKSYTGWVQ